MLQAILTTFRLCYRAIVEGGASNHFDHSSSFIDRVVIVESTLGCVNHIITIEGVLGCVSCIVIVESDLSYL